MDTFSNDSVTQMVSNAKSYLIDKFDAIINGSFFKKIRKKFEYCMGHPEFKKQIIQVIVNNIRLQQIMMLMKLMMQLLMNFMNVREISSIAEYVSKIGYNVV